MVLKFFFFLKSMQSWLKLRKLAQDLVMRMQKIDGDNYPEVGGCSVNFMQFWMLKKTNIGLVY